MKKLVKSLLHAIAPRQYDAWMTARANKHGQKIMEEAGVPKIAGEILAQCGNRVQTGPFAGMEYITESIGSSFIPKLIGSYECEIHPALDRILNTQYAVVVDIGSAEGFYVVGLTLKLPGTPEIYAFDIDLPAQNLCRQLAQQNGVASRVNIEGFCDTNVLNRILNKILSEPKITEANNTETNNTEANKTEANKTEANKTEANKTEANKTEANKTEANKTEANKTEANKTEANNTEAEISQRALIICDCEGYEAEILAPQAVPALRRADILVEFHEHLKPGSTKAILERFQSTHSISLMDTQERDPTHYPSIAFLPIEQQKIALSEFRNGPQQWAYIRCR